MSKIKKLIFSLVLLTCTLAFTAYGVFAAVNSSLTINSTVTFNPTDLALRIKGATSGGIFVDDSNYKSTYLWTNYTSDSQIDTTTQPSVWTFKANFDPEDPKEFPEIVFTITVMNYMSFSIKGQASVEAVNPGTNNQSQFISSTISGTSGVTTIAGKTESTLTIKFKAVQGHNVSFANLPYTIKIIFNK